MRGLTCVIFLAFTASAVVALPHREVREVQQPEYGAMDSLSDLWNVLQRAAQIGSEEVERVLADPRVEALIQRLTGLAKHAALKMIRFVRSMLEKSSGSSTEGYFRKFDTREDIQLFQAVLRNLTIASETSKEALREALLDPQINKNLFVIRRPFVKEMYQNMLFHFMKLANIEFLGYAAATSSDMDMLKELWHTLTVAATAGKDALLRVLQDPQIQKSVNNLGSFARNMALKMLSMFEKELEGEKVSAYALANNEAASIIERVHHMLEAAQRIGITALKQLLESEELASIIQHLPEEILMIVKAYIEMFAQLLQDMLEIEQITALIAVVESGDGSDNLDDVAIVEMISYASSLEPMDEQEKVTAAEIVRMIIRYIDQSAAEGKMKLLEALESEEIKAMLGKLPRYLQSVVEIWLRGLNTATDGLEKLRDLLAKMQ